MRNNNPTLISGNIFESKMKTLVIPVNTLGIMGAGLAKKFKELYPQGYEIYRAACQKDMFTPRGIVSNIIKEEKYFIYFATKIHWKDKSNEIEIMRILLNLEWEITHHPDTYESLAVPALGCGLGELDWSEMEPIFTEHFSSYPIPVELYRPH